MLEFSSCGSIFILATLILWRQPTWPPISLKSFFSLNASRNISEMMQIASKCLTPADRSRSWWATSVSPTLTSYYFIIEMRSIELSREDIVNCQSVSPSYWSIFAPPTLSYFRGGCGWWVGGSYYHLETSKTFSENLDLTLSYSYSHSSTLIQSYTHTTGLKYETHFFGNLWKSHTGTFLKILTSYSHTGSWSALF